MSIYHKEKSEYFNRAMLSIWDEQTIKPNEIILNNKIISLGTLISRKGFERLIRAWSFVEPFSNEYILEI